MKDGTVAKYEQSSHQRNMVAFYALPCNEEKCKIDRLFPDLIDPQATRELWLQDPPEDDEPPPHWH